MTPIRFYCADTLRLPPADIAARILDLSNWTDFKGYLLLPGIKSAEFEIRTPEVVGSRIRVTSTDGSSHVEEIAEWDAGRRVRLRFGDFSRPLSRLATAFEELWEFEPAGDATRVTRSFELHPKSRLARPVLWLISLMLRRAVARNLREMRESARAEPGGRSS